MGGGDASLCVACMTPTRTVLCPCSHPMCEPCALTWFKRKLTCPTCRGTVLKVHPSSHNPYLVRVVPPMVTDGKVGLALSPHAEGVLVQKVHKNTPAQLSGIRCDDVVTHINGIPICRPRQAFEMFQRAREYGENVRCTILVKRPSWLLLVVRRLHSRSRKAVA